MHFPEQPLIRNDSYLDDCSIDHVDGWLPFLFTFIEYVGSNTVYSVIHGLTGTSIELQPCLGMSWYDLDSNLSRVYTNKAWIYSIKQGLSRFKHDLQTIFIRLFYGSYLCLLRPSTIKHDFYSLSTGLTYHRLLFEFDSVRCIFDIYTVELTRGVDFMCGCMYGLSRYCTVSRGLVRLLIRLYTDMAPVSVF